LIATALLSGLFFVRLGRTGRMSRMSENQAKLYLGRRRPSVESIHRLNRRLLAFHIAVSAALLLAGVAALLRALA